MDRPEDRQDASPDRLKVIPVAVPGRPSHDIVVGTGILDELPRRIISLGLSRDILIISSPRIYGLYGQQLTDTLKTGGCGRIAHALLPDGEENKTFERYGELCAEAGQVEDRFGTRVLIVDLGGGVVMDLGGFVAATHRRGRDYIQVPTTLLGDVDCGIGGKTGVNHNGKNQIGAFYQPRLVLADLSFLRSLPIREIRSGLAEAIKYGVIFDADLFTYLEAHVTEALTLEPRVIAHVVDRSFELKTRTVEEDEHETKGVREKLNFGHTIGHALEAATDYARYAHGEAVAIGMLCACELAERLGMYAPTETRRVEALCEAVGLPTHIERASIDSIMNYMRSDKKFVNGTNRFILPTSIGTVVRKDGIDDTLIRWVINGRMRAR